MFRRPPRGGRGLVGTMATTAVVVGTASAVSNSANQKAAAKAQAQQNAAQLEAQERAQVAEMQAQLNALQAQAAPVAAAPAAAAAPAGGDLMTQLRELAELKQAGVLTDDEFTAAKAKLLAS